MPELCLGTVQFGMVYGITNQAGQVTENEVKKIFSLAASSGIQLMDTAQSYGNAESVIGKCWPTQFSKRIISKLPLGTKPEHWESQFISSLKKLRVKKLDGFLLHSAKELTGPYGQDLLEWLESLRSRKLVNRIGLSIYNSSELESIPLERIQIIQLPLSIYDQRLLADGTIDRLKKLGISIHVRSILLQGLLLQEKESLPSFLSVDFFDHHARWSHFLNQRGLSKLEAAFSFVNSVKAVDAIVFGILSANELKQIIRISTNLKNLSINEYKDWAWKNVEDIDPRNWPTQ